jgi:hypothetical protein
VHIITKGRPRHQRLEKEGCVGLFSLLDSIVPLIPLNYAWRVVNLCGTYIGMSRPVGEDLLCRESNLVLHCSVLTDKNIEFIVSDSYHAICGLMR